MEQKFCFDDAVFTYAVAPEPLQRFSRHTPVLGGALTVSHTSKTEVRSAGRDGREIVIIGLCVDAHGEVERDGIPELILNQPQRDPLPVYRFCDRFAGKYVILYRNEEGVYLFGDATSSVQMNYSLIEDSLCVASIDRLTAEYCGYDVSEYSLSIRKGAASSQALPNDVTMYDKVKALLPNHYLDVSRGQAVRVSLDLPQDISSKQEFHAAMERSAGLIRQITQEYVKYHSIVCPLTSGYDSRVVFVFLKKAVRRLSCFTFRHHFTDKDGDIWVPQKLCGESAADHTLIEDLSAETDYARAVKEIIGNYHSTNTIDRAYTLSYHFPGQATVGGDIIGQIGKTSLSGSIPVQFATPSFFRCKIHNQAQAAKEELRQYLSKIHETADRRYVFDLFSLENRCGRWGAQGGMIYSVCSIATLNIFNCRELILTWFRIPRKLRVKKKIHYALIGREDSQLLKTPFHPGEKFGFAAEIWPLLLLGTHAKYYVNCFLKTIRDRKEDHT